MVLNIPVILSILMMKFFVSVKPVIMAKNVSKNVQILVLMEVRFIKTENVNVFVLLIHQKNIMQTLV